MARADIRRSKPSPLGGVVVKGSWCLAGLTLGDLLVETVA